MSKIDFFVQNRFFRRVFTWVFKNRYFRKKSLFPEKTEKIGLRVAKIRVFAHVNYTKNCIFTQLHSTRNFPFFSVFSSFYKNGKFRKNVDIYRSERSWTKVKFLKKVAKKFSFEKVIFRVILRCTELCKLSKTCKNAFFGVFEKRKIELDSNRGLSFLIFGSFEILRCLTFWLILGRPYPADRLNAPHILAGRT